MTPHDLLASFETLADAPDGVKRLRELVLQLAVRGKLVPQDPRDEPASVLVERVARAAETAPKNRVAVEYEKATPWAGPSGWEWVYLGAAMGLVNGHPFKPAEWTKAGLPIVRIQNLNDPTAPFNYYDAEVPDRFHITDDDLLLSWSGTPGTSFGAFIWRRGPAILNQHIFRCEPRGEAFFLDFLRLAINSRLDEMIRLAHGGVGLRHITKGKLEGLWLPVPPLAEQHRIVARVDELMGLLDQLETARTSRDDVRGAARDAALAALRDAEDSDAVEAAWGRIARRIDELFADPEDVGSLRETILDLGVGGALHGKNDALPWTESTLGAVLVDGPTNGWSPKTVEHETPIKTLKLSATTRGRFDGTYSKFVDTTEEVDPRLWLKPGDLLIQRSNTPEYVGTAAIFDGPTDTFIYPDLMMRCRVSPEHSVRFIHLALLAPTARAWLRERASGTSQSMVKVNQATVRSTPLTLPPLAEQHRIVAKVDGLMSICDDLETRLAAAREVHGSFAAASVHHLDL